MKENKQVIINKEFGNVFENEEVDIDL